MTTSARWRGYSKKARIETMRTLAQKKAKRMTKAERTEHARAMVAARGHWEITSKGKRVYIRHVK